MMLKSNIVKISPFMNGKLISNGLLKNLKSRVVPTELVLIQTKPFAEYSALKSIASSRYLDGV